MDLKEIVSTNLKRLASRRGLSQAELAERSGLSRPVVNRYFKGLASPGAKNLEALARGLSCEPLELVRGEQPVLAGVTKEDVRSAVDEALVNLHGRSLFDGLNRASPSQLLEKVQEFGGWDYLYDFIVEDLESRKQRAVPMQELVRSTEFQARFSSSKDRKKIITELIRKAGENEKS